MQNARSWTGARPGARSSGRVLRRCAELVSVALVLPKRSSTGWGGSSRPRQLQSQLLMQGRCR
eukprot:3071929-Pyramimonas_sp.AAC.1